MLPQLSVSATSASFWPYFCWVPEVWFDSVPATRFGRVRWLAEVSSTNAELMELARQGAEEGEVLIADYQSAGRGRRGRTWIAPPGAALMMSVLLRPASSTDKDTAKSKGQLAPAQASLVVSAWACAAAQACESVVGISPTLKWPNDLVVTVDEQSGQPESGDTAGPVTKKIAGILSESLISDGAITALVIGMGLNTGWQDIPAELADAATSLNILSGHDVDRAALAAKLLTGFEQRYADLLGESSSPVDNREDDNRGGIAQILTEVRQRCSTLGCRVRVERETSAGGTLYGNAVDINSDGTLLVVDESGTQHRVSAGEVVHLRPAD